MDQVTPIEWAVVGLCAGLLLVSFRLVDGMLKAKALDRRGLKVRSEVLVRLEKLELELTRIPRDVAEARDVDALEKRVEELDARAKSALTHGTAERIVSAHNLLMQDVQALKQWQAETEQAGELASALDPTHPGKESRT